MVPKSRVVLGSLLAAAVALCSSCSAGWRGVEREAIVYDEGFKPFDVQEHTQSKHSANPRVAIFGSRESQFSPDIEKQRAGREFGAAGLSREVEDPGAKPDERNEGVLVMRYEANFGKSGRMLEVIEDHDTLPVLLPAIVVGAVKGGQGFVSLDRKRVYSDYEVEILQVLTHEGTSLQPGQRIVAWRDGASVMFPSGYIRHYLLKGEGFPAVGGEYLFFLNAPPKDTRAYPIYTAFELGDEKAYAIDARDELLKFDGVARAKLLQLVKDGIASATSTKFPGD